MKKITFLLSVMLLACTTSLWAAEDIWTWTAATKNDLGTTTPASVTLNGKAWTVTRSSVVYTGWSSSCIQLGSSNGAETVTLTSSAFTGTIKSVAVECASYKGKHTIAISVGETSYLAATATSSWQTVETKTGKGSVSGDITITFTPGTSARALYIKSITVVTEPVDPNTVATPTFTVTGTEANGSYITSANVEIACATEGAAISYSTDNGTTWNAYSTALTITETTTLQAKATNADMTESGVATRTITIIPSIANTKETALTTTEAIALIDATSPAQLAAEKVYVKGTISEVTSFNETYGSLTYTITDGTNPFVIYGGLDIDGAKFTGTNNLNVGDEVVVKGIMMKYNETTYEMDKNNQLVSRVVKTPIIEADNVLFGNVFSTGKTKELVVAGYNLTDAITYTLSEDAAFTVDGTLTAEGGTLTITFTGTTDGDYSATLKLTSGTITLPVTISASLLSLTGEGTKENPFTVEDVVALNNTLDPKSKYWVIGYILGSCSSATAIAKTPVNSNLALGGTAEATTFIPVALPEGDARTALNVKDNTENVGKQVKVCGTLEAYFSVAGVKNVKTADEYEIMSTPSAIDNTNAETPALKTIENGQLIIIRDGKKYNAMGVRL